MHVQVKRKSHFPLHRQVVKTMSEYSALCTRDSKARHGCALFVRIPHENLLEGKSCTSPIPTSLAQRLRTYATLSICHSDSFNQCLGWVAYRSVCWIRHRKKLRIGNKKILLNLEICFITYTIVFKHSLTCLPVCVCQGVSF